MTEQVRLDFADGKDDGAFRTIGEVSEHFGIKQHVLRYWEDQFPMLKPLKRAGGRRYYRPDDVTLVAQINRLLYSEGYTIRGARQALEGGVIETPPPPPPSPTDSGGGGMEPARLSPAPSGLVQRLRAIRADLAGALDR